MTQTLADFHVNGLTEPAYGYIRPPFTPTWRYFSDERPDPGRSVRLRLGEMNLTSLYSLRLDPVRWARYNQISFAFDASGITTTLPELQWYYELERPQPRPHHDSPAIRASAQSRTKP